MDINILIPMAGQGKRFKEAGYKEPKPMISIGGRPMIGWALESFQTLKSPHRFTFIALEADLDKGLRELLDHKGEIVGVSSVTEGAVNTTLLASGYIDEGSPLVIANCDQFLQWDFEKFLDSAQGFDCSVAVFESRNPHHSYIQASGPKILRVKEKEVISSLACGGVYFYRKGIDYLNGAKKLIQDEDRTNGEFYVTPIFNKLIAEGKTATYFEVAKQDIHMLGTPEEVDLFLKQLNEMGKSI